MEKTTRDIRREAVEAWIDHTKDWDEHDYHYADPKDSFIEGAAWARNEALREAAKTARSTTEIPMHSHWGDVIADGILELVEERVTIPNPDHTPLGKYEVID